MLQYLLLAGLLWLGCNTALTLTYVFLPATCQAPSGSGCIAPLMAADQLINVKAGQDTGHGLSED